IPMTRVRARTGNRCMHAVPVAYRQCQIVDGTLLGRIEIEKKQKQRLDNQPLILHIKTARSDIGIRKIEIDQTMDQTWRRGLQRRGLYDAFSLWFARSHRRGYCED